MVAQRVDAADQAIERRIGRIPRSGVDDGLKVLTTTANHSLLWFAIAAALASRRGTTRRAAIRGVCAIGVTSFLANAVGKPVLPRRRPAPAWASGEEGGPEVRPTSQATPMPTAGQRRTVTESSPRPESNTVALPEWRALPNPPTSSSFPSGHAASAAAFATAVAMEAPLAGAVVAPIAATVAYSRMHTGVHWTSDVVAGALLGSGVALATRRWWPVRPQQPAKARPHADAPALPEGEGLVVVANRSSGPTDSVDELAELLPKARSSRWRPATIWPPGWSAR